MTPIQVAPGVWAAGTRFVNYYVVDGGADGLTLVDAGLPGYSRRLGPTLAAIGHAPGDVRAVLLTHGHVDHVGMAQPLADAGATIYLHEADAALAADPRLNKTDRPLLPYLRYPATVAFVVHAVREGATKHRGAPGLVPMRDLKHLKVLDLGHTHITGLVLKPLRSLLELRTLHLNNTRINNEAILSLRGLPKLQSLNVSCTDVTDSGLDAFRSIAGFQPLNVCTD